MSDEKKFLEDYLNDFSQLIKPDVENNRKTNSFKK